MTFAIAAAGTGGHVYPGLAVGEALVDAGVDPSHVLYIGGDRLEARVYPAAGFPFLAVEVRGLARRLTPSNLTLPGVVLRAVRTIQVELTTRRVGAVLGMGGYVSVPTAVAARRAGARLAIAEQNAEAGLASRITARLAQRVFAAFPRTRGLARAEWVGNPIRRPLARFDRHLLRPRALRHWELDDAVPVLGVFGGSLGAGAVNGAVAAMLDRWGGPPLQVVHLAGHGFDEMTERARVSRHRWVVLDFCDEMDLFYAACDMVVARAGGSVAELTATSTPAVLIPGGFGSGRHQEANAAVLEEAGCAVVVDEKHPERLGPVIRRLAEDGSRRRQMAQAATRLARPQAAAVVAEALQEMER